MRMHEWNRLRAAIHSVTDATRAVIVHPEKRIQIQLYRRNSPYVSHRHVDVEPLPEWATEFPRHVLIVTRKYMLSIADVQEESCAEAGLRQLLPFLAPMKYHPLSFVHVPATSWEHECVSGVMPAYLFDRLREKLQPFGLHLPGDRNDALLRCGTLIRAAWFAHLDRKPRFRWVGEEQLPCPDCEEGEEVECKVCDIERAFGNEDARKAAIKDRCARCPHWRKELDDKETEPEIWYGGCVAGADCPQSQKICTD